MSEEEGLVPAGAAADGETLLYDYFKWLTSLSLITLGGVLSLAQAAKLTLSPFQAGAMVVPICIAGITSLYGADTLVRARVTGRAPRIRPHRYMHVSITALGVGTGAFLATFWSSLT